MTKYKIATLEAVKAKKACDQPKTVERNFVAVFMILGFVILIDALKFMGVQ